MHVWPSLNLILFPVLCDQECFRVNFCQVICEFSPTTTNFFEEAVKCNNVTITLMLTLMSHHSNLLCLLIAR